MSPRLRGILPNRLRTGRMAMVPLFDGKPDVRAWRPFSAVQIIGGKRWSLAVIRLQSQEDMVSAHGPQSNTTTTSRGHDR